MALCEVFISLTGVMLTGTASAFKHVYEDPILKSRQPSSSSGEVTLGENRAAELNRITGLFILRRTSDVNNKYLPPKGAHFTYSASIEHLKSL